MSSILKLKPNTLISKTWEPLLSLLLILSVISIYWFYFQKTQITVATWWNDSWSYRQAIEITNNTNEQTNVYVSLTLNTLTASTSMQSDCGDFRFTTAGGVVLPYYIVSGCRTASNIIHVNFETFPAGAQTIYFYYGNPSAANGFSAPAGSGTVTQANMRLSIVNGTAFADFSSAGTLTNYTGNKVVITDSAGKTLTGYIKAAGTGETYASSLIVNGGFDSDTSWSKQGSWAISGGVASYSSGGSSDWLWQDISVTNGALYKGQFTCVTETAWGPSWLLGGYQLYLGDCLGNGGVNSIYRTTSSGGNQNTGLNTAGFIGSVDDYSYINVLTPSATGVTITSTANGSTYNWASEESGFNRNDSSNYSYTVYPLAFSVEASNYTVGSAATAEIGPGPVGYWSFDEGYGTTAHDETANKNDGTITGSTWQNESQCVSGKCIRFNGANLTRITADTPDNMAKLTACTWMKANTLTNADNDTEIVLLDKGFLLSFDNAGKISFYISTTSSYPWVYSNEHIVANKWYQICGVFYGIGINPDLYINGINKSQYNTEGSGSLTDDSSDLLYIGASSNEYSANFNGFIDEVKIYPYARSADQIKADYAAGLAGTKSEHGVSASFGSVSDKWMSDGLVGYWPMDESATTSGVADLSGDGNTGNFSSHASTTAGKFGRGGVFDGTDDYVSIPDSSNLDITSEITIAAWIKLDAINRDNKIAVKDTPYWSGVYLTNNKLEGAIVSGGTEYYQIRFVEGGTTLTTGVWYHAVFLFDGRYAKTYINGNLDRTYDTGATRTIDTNDGILSIGSQGGGLNFMDGQIDETRIYNRTLSASEVKKLYEWAPGPVAHWKFDEKQGTTAYDSAASTTFSGGNHGTLGGSMATLAFMPTWTRGKLGSALQFDGVNDLVIAGIIYTPEITITMWVKPDQNSADRRIFDMNGGDPMIRQIGSSNFQYVSPGVFLDGVTSVNSGIWYHIAVVGSAGGRFLYVNGKLDALDTAPYAVNNSNVSIIGGSTDSFDGTIDDVRIYNYARTQKQILQDMNGGGPGAETRLIASLHLAFDEGKGATAYDSSGYGNNGTLYPGTGGTNTATSAMWTMDGKFGKAIEFDGVDDYINCGNGIETKLYNNDYTISAWINLNSYGSSYSNYIIGRAENITGYGFKVTGILDDNPKKLSVMHFGGATYIARSDTDVPLNSWHHVLVTYDNSDNIITFYLDGKQNGAKILSSQVEESQARPLVIGVDPRASFSGYVPDGRIDEIKIYHYALTEEEIKLDYNRGVGAMMGQTGKSNSTATSSGAASLEYCVPGSTDYCAPPVGEWKMDEKTGNTAYDTSGNGSDGILYWMATSTNGGWTRGKIGSALNFDGVDDYVSSADIDMPAGNIVTVSAWVKYSAAQQPGNNNEGYIVAKNQYQSSDPYHLYVTSTNRINFSASSDLTVSSLNPHNDGKWHFAVGVRNGNNVYLYIDGVLNNSDTSGTGVTNNNDLVTIGGDDASSNYRPFLGQIDQARIYEYVRTPAQIAYEFNRGQPIAEWRFDECKGGVIYDSAKSWNGGTANNGQLYLGTSGVTATGTCASSSSSTFWGSGSPKLGSGAGSFDGVDDFASAASGSNFDLTDFTYSAWIKADATDNYRTIIDIDNDEQLLDVYNGRINIYGRCGSVSVGSISIGVWYHVAWTVSGSSYAVFLNGYQIGANSTCSAGVDADRLNIGAGYTGGIPNELFDGLIDEVKIFNYALTAEQIKSEYSGGAVRFGD